MEVKEIKQFLKEKYPNYTGFIEHTLVANMVKTFTEHYQALQLHKTHVSGSVFEKYELEYIDHLVDTDFDLNHETFSKSKIETVTILLEKIKKLRLS